MERDPGRNYFQKASRLKIMELLVQNLSWIIFVIAIITHKKIFSCVIALIVMLLVVVVKWFRRNYQGLAEENRREEFWENSFKTRTSSQRNDNYYNNDEKEGLYKAFVNIFESSLFSTVIAEKMLKRNRIKNMLMVTIYIAISAIAIFTDEYYIAAISILLILFIIGDWLVLLRYASNVQKIHVKIREMFEDGLSGEKFNEKEKQCDALIIVMEYEVNIAQNCIMLNSSIFKQINDSLSLEWKELKKKYGIMQ